MATAGIPYYGYGHYPATTAIRTTAIGYGYPLPYGYPGFSVGFSYRYYGYPAYACVAYGYAVRSPTDPQSPARRRGVRRHPHPGAPRNAEVYVDGRYAGIVDDYDGTFQRLDLEPGSHEIEIRAPAAAADVRRQRHGRARRSRSTPR